MKLMKQGHQHIEQRHDRGQTSLNERFQAMEDPLEATDDREQGERRLDDHAVIPGAFGTHFAVLWDATFLAKAVIGQHDAASTELLNERLKLVVRDIHRIPVPIDDLAEVIENPTQLDAETPSSLVFRFFAKLLGTSPFPNGKQQFNRKTIYDQEQAGIGQQALVPVLMRDQQPLQTSAIRQPAKQGVVVPFEPAIKGAKVASFQGKQQADRHQLARIQLRLVMLGNLLHTVIDKAKDLDDNVFGGHNSLSFRECFCSSLLDTCVVTSS